MKKESPSLDMNTEPEQDQPKEGEKDNRISLKKVTDLVAPRNN